MTSTTPRLFRLVKLLSHNKVPGSGRLLSACRRYWAKETIAYTVSSNVRLAVPIGRKEHCWDLKDILEYEKELIEAFCSALGSLSNVTLFDCGADIGLFSAVACSRCDCIRRVLAFEPNPDIQLVFRRNIRSLPNGEPHASAVGRFQGFGRLERPDYDTSDHARYLVPSESGIPVITLDSLSLFGGDIAIKIDVEGGELDILCGAKETIRNASHCLVTLEVHPRVYERTGIAPNVCMAFLESIRPFRFVVAETGQCVDPSDSIIDFRRVLNILALSLAE